MDGLDDLRRFWEEALLEELGFMCWVVDQRVVCISEGWEGVSGATFADFCKRPDVLCVGGLMEFVVGPVSFGMGDAKLEGF